MFQRDLAAARSEWIREAKTDDERQRREQSEFLQYANAAGEVADFHAQRHTYISGIVAGGQASVKTCQDLARHSTPVLTIGRYSHAGAGTEKGAGFGREAGTRRRLQHYGGREWPSSARVFLHAE